MKTFTFRTSINCGGCVAKVTPVLNAAQGIEHWSVDIDNKDKILTVASNGITEEEVVGIIKKAGFEIEKF